MSSQHTVPWHEIDTVLLDMDGTLLDLHFDNYFWLTHLPKRFSEIHQVDYQQASQDIERKIRSLEGTLQWYCLDHWSDLMNLDIPLLKLELIDKIKVRPNVEQFLQALRDTHKRLILITNAHPAGLEIKLNATKIDRFLDIVISSHDFGSPKEDQDFWQQLNAKEQFDPARSLFIDDTTRILRSAKHFGIQHLICVMNPDSEKPAHSPEEFHGILDFGEIMPTTPNT